MDWGRTASFKKEYLKLKNAVAKAPDDPRTRYEFATVLDRGGRHNAALSELERAIQLDPNRLLYGNAYRELIRKYGPAHADRSIHFFEDLVERHPDSVMARLNKALAYVDKMPLPMLGIVSQGMLSNKSIAELNRVLEQDPGSWTARFIRGMNHLHWPRKLGHVPLAIRDFTELIALQRAFPPEKRPDHFALAYVCLGDAHIKNRAIGLDECLAQARSAWQQGLKEFPDSPELKQRLALLNQSATDLIDYVERLRGLEDPVDTDLTRVWVE